MSKIEEILALARSRSKDWPYAGAVTPQEAFDLLSAEPATKLVDVRTHAERDWVGKVAIPDAQYSNVQWMLYPGGLANPDFIEQLNTVARKDQVCCSCAVPVYVRARLPKRPPSMATCTATIFWKASKATRMKWATAATSMAGARMACRG